MQLGDPISIMRIGERQLKARSPQNAGKSTVRIKKKSMPGRQADGSATSPFLNQVWAAFGQAASQAFNGSMEQVNASVRRNLKGLNTGAQAEAEAERQYRHNTQTPENIAKFSQAAGRGGVGVSFREQPVRESGYPPYR